MSMTEHGSDLAGLVREDLGRWRLSVVPIIANHWGAIYGGAALGASIDIAMRETGTAVRWATTRFLAAPSDKPLTFVTPKMQRDAERATERSSLWWTKNATSKP
jgi:hypothetical protein